MHEDRVYPRGAEFDLAKMIYALSAAALVYVTCKSVWAGFFTEAMRRNLPEAGMMSNYAYSLLILSFVIPMFGVTLAYTRGRSTLKWAASANEPTANHLKNGIIGVPVGICAAVLVAPIISREEPRQWLLAWAVNRGLDFTPVGLGTLLLVFIAVPFLSEIVFRGVVLRTLASYASFPAALIASSLMFAYLWPVLSWPAGAVFGLFSGLLYGRTRCLTGPVVANVAFTLCVIPAVTLYHMLPH